VAQTGRHEKKFRPPQRIFWRRAEAVMHEHPKVMQRRGASLQLPKAHNEFGCQRVKGSSFIVLGNYNEARTKSR
jgi:hypothetical protein